MNLTSISTLDIYGASAVILGVLGYAFYVRSILKKEVKPHAFSWFIWGILTAIAFLAQVVEGGGPGAWVTGFTAFASFGFAIVGLGASSRIFIAKSDWVFFTASILAIPIWYFTGNPLWSVILITIIDAAAFVPTFRKAYHHPLTENAWTYGLSGIKFIFGLLALQSFTWTTALYPASLVVANAGFVSMMLWRRQQARK